MIKVTRRRLAVLCLVLAGGAVLWWWLLTPPEIMKQVREPREGRVLIPRAVEGAGRPEDERVPDPTVAIVFSANYDISFGGLELLYHFDIHKYANIYMKLVNDGLLAPEDVFVPEEIAREDLLLVHTEEYLSKLGRPGNVARYLEFGPVAYVPSGIVDKVFLRAFRYVTGGSVLASRLALKHGIGVNLGGGYHHAKPNKGGGFCVYADVPIAVRKLQKEGLLKRALLVDLDAHQGDGSAICFKDDDDVFTFSIHEENLYPVPKAKSDLDIGLTGEIDDARYLKVLRDHLPEAIGEAKPDIIYLLGGTDVYVGDRLGHMRLTTEGILKRDMFVIDSAVSRGIPVVMVLSGGYCPKSWELHYNTVRRIIETYGQVKEKGAHESEQ